jgi:hypothetical protein
MSWSKIAGAFKRLDDRLSDAVYLHGCGLTGQEKIVRHPGQDNATAQEYTIASGVHVPLSRGATHGERIDAVGLSN